MDKAINVRQWSSDQDVILSRELFETLRNASFDGVGVTRESFGPGESVALDIVEAKAREFGLTVERDAAANLVVTLRGTAPELPFLGFGSHLDSVPRGGNFDGAAGVVAGLVILADLRRNDVQPRRTLKLYGLRGEESARFGRPYIGSKALFGRLTEKDLESADIVTGQTLDECMANVGADIGRIRAGEILLNPSEMAVWIELHIEQGPVLASRGLPVGIVTGVRGNIRHRVVECVGEAGHSGAVPRNLRHDAVFATAKLIANLDRHWEIVSKTEDLVVTTGVISTDVDEHAISRIPGRVYFSFEIRSDRRETLEAFYKQFLLECAAVGKENGVDFKLDLRHESFPAVMDPDWIERLKAAALHFGLQDELIPSGAGHDAAIFSESGIPSAMIFVRNTHGSHNPDEAMEIDDFLAGVEVMRHAIMDAAK